MGDDDIQLWVCPSRRPGLGVQMASRLVLDAWIEEELGKCMGLKLIMIRWGLLVSGWIEKSGMECKEWLGLGSAVLPRVHF